MEFLALIVLAIFAFGAYKLWYVPRGTSRLGSYRNPENQETDKK